MLLLGGCYYLSTETQWLNNLTIGKTMTYYFQMTQLMREMSIFQLQQTTLGSRLLIIGREILERVKPSIT